ncbi:MAG: S-layer homology domain-containing protein, partial [Thermoleophilia bacterium]|nr:S-layer homology domain-containing protein [Thermoleophilia bacterium]
MVFSTVSIAVAATTSFPDVPLSHPQRPAITALASWGIISGFPDGTFGPDNPVTRQQFAKMIVLSTDYPVSEGDICPFTDVLVSGPHSLYPDNYIAAGATMGIIMGKTLTRFDPSGYITRYQVVSMAVRLVDSAQPGLLVAPAAGWAGNAAWASSPIHGANAARAEYNGLLEGLDLDTLDPSGSMTRAEVAQVLYNLLGGSAPEAPSGTLLYSDDFSDSASGWGDTREEPLQSGGCGYSNGAYFVECPADSSWTSLAPYQYGVGGVRDGRIEADLTLVSGVA